MNGIKTRRVALSLITDSNDFQREQASAAELVARRLGIDLRILYADNDAITQSQQLLGIIQSEAREVDAIIAEPAGGTALPQVAQAAAAKGIAWVVLNRDADYAEELSRKYRVPVFAVSADHEEIGRIQARQLSALLPRGGSVLYVQGPSNSSVAKQRTLGLQGGLNHNIQPKLLRSATWTEPSGYQAIESWLKLVTSRREAIDVVAGQNDAIAIGARKALQELSGDSEGERWSKTPFIGIDGLPNTGRAWVARGMLTATIVVPPNTVPALELLVAAMSGTRQPPPVTYVAPTSFPDLKVLGSPGGGTGFCGG